jgi:poly-gamma-glutamate synthesis protein (capsule biosynthesis protein)
VDVCELANNHVMDWGTLGLIETLTTLKNAGLATAGAGATREEAWRPAVAYLEAGRHVVIAGVGHGSSGIPREWAATDDQPGVALLSDLSEASAEAVGDAVGSAEKPRGVAVVSVHWGSNWGYEVPPQHRSFAHALIDRGVDVVHAHSSHHPRPIEVYRGKLILYGCGDFIDDYEGIGGHDSFRDDLVLMYFPSIDAGTGKLIELRMMPMRIRRMRLERAAPHEVSWLEELLTGISRPYGTDIVRVGTNELVAFA